MIINWLIFRIKERIMNYARELGVYEDDATVHPDVIRRNAAEAARFALARYRVIVDSRYAVPVTIAK
jgi:hypothetical protein